MILMRITSVTPSWTCRWCRPRPSRSGAASFAHSAALRFPGDSEADASARTPVPPRASPRRRGHADITWGAPQPRAPARGRISPELLKLRVEDLAEGRRGAERHEGRGDRVEVLFGVAPCLLAVTQGRRELYRLCVKEGVGPQRGTVQRVCEEARRWGVPIQRCSRAQLDSMSGRRVHQGVCLEASPLQFLSDSRKESSNRETRTPPLWLVLDGIQDPMNFGAILRSAYFLGVDRIASSLRSSCPLTPVVSKASSGVMEVMGVYGYNSLSQLLKEKVSRGWHVLGSVGTTDKTTAVPVLDCVEFRLSRPTLLLMGGEGAGLSPELLSLCHTLVTVRPRHQLHPAVESLNVSVATGILLHSLLMSRGGPCR
ncbi:LOW QUALITY PROTEIN: rRNA methyltransferase 1, mitochondrial [Brienomyrus brachyistius]|uniref:LOW QUALITY PROTEIN: rRNA methyltransferase 1, mitochondrial n=1 Tax=Brienomyrus brachyistius TaxID=42636 RepID=UPI0020B2F4A0|nr:LOW QUALITY PROTEIN: rRNA methyltransferase 1, mitochondrial [Brienomyrus brachyistius]